MPQRRSSLPLLLLPGSPAAFPSPTLAPADGLLAIGGDLSLPRLLAAYDAGVFPWYSAGQPPLWWSPDPRCVMDAEHLHVSRSLRRTQRRGGYRLTWNQAFTEVLRACATEHEGGTWILDEVQEAYTLAHRAGHAHSAELWVDGRLVGGLYGVQRGALFAAESMFHRATDASKLTLVHALGALFAAGITLFDVQFMTPHLASLGAYELPRREYLRRLEQARRRPVELGGLFARPLEVPRASAAPR